MPLGYFLSFLVFSPKELFFSPFVIFSYVFSLLYILYCVHGFRFLLTAPRLQGCYKETLYNIKSTWWFYCCHDQQVSTHRALQLAAFGTATLKPPAGIKVVAKWCILTLTESSLIT